MNEQEQAQMQKVLQKAREYLQRGWKVVPLIYKEKKTYMEGWQNLKIREDELEKYFLENEQPHNIGILLGEPSSWLTDIDLDHPLAVEAAPALLPSTGAVFGRASAKFSHWLYYSINAISKPYAIPAKLAKQITGNENEQELMLLEIRSTGRQTMAPPSIHPSNEVVEWFSFGEPAQVEYARLVKATGKIASASLLALVWQKGTRQDTAMALAGALLRSGWSEEEVQAYIEVVAGLANDEETRDRLRAAEYTAKKIGASPTTGWRRLSELLGEEVVRLVMEWLQVKKEKEETAETRTEVKIWSATELIQTEFKEPTWLVPKLIPGEGITLLAGKPKTGKSWLALNIAIGVANGESVAGIKVAKQTRTLYLSLEDTPRRLKNRIEIAGLQPSEDCLIATQWLRMKQGGIELLKRTIEEKHIGIVIIDTLAKIKPREGKDTSLYTADYENLSILKDIADTYGIALLVIHHLRKGDTEDPLEAVSGTTGITGAVDTVLVLKKSRGQADATLFITGRDVEEKELAMNFEGGKWQIIGDAREYAITQERKDIMEAIKALGGSATPREIANYLGKNYNTIKVLLMKMASEGLVNSVGGVYGIIQVL